ncbi:MAG: hypothetical protein IPJ27_15270 [Candidatus Accumulibacter sp.]|uniref:Hemerythrin-like domain-containing protein n=1 Tax=Candidatus Accumulibacter proximus TaxID=2954385 RepID=A0A935UHX9_9PROT|nr:hypothetical protein [Candidatus Accumulibacter proximus]
MNERIQRRVSATEGLAFNTLKTLITWGDDFKIDAGRLDQEHQKIFRLALEASGLSHDAADADRLAVVLDEFGNAIKEHFAYEESVLGGIGHPRSMRIVPSTQECSRSSNSSVPGWQTTQERGCPIGQLCRSSTS